MIRGILMAALAAMLLPTGGAAAQKAWKEFSARSLGFAILFPGEPPHDQQSFRAAIGQLVSHTYGIAYGDTSLSVTCVEYPEGVIQPGQAAQMFNTHRDGMVKGTQGRLI